MKIILILLILLVLWTLVYKRFYDGTDWFLSTIDNKYYKVRPGGSDIKQIKANLLGTLYTKLNILVNALKNDNSLKNNTDVNRLILKWNEGITMKEMGVLEWDAAYVINKKYMSICLVNFCDKFYCKNINSIENINLLTYVGIHELAHVMSLETGHGDEFKRNFVFVLNYSKNITYYDPLLKQTLPLYIDLTKLKTPDNFCGVSVINSIS